jgi:putative endonuclease
VNRSPEPFALLKGKLREGEESLMNQYYVYIMTNKSKTLYTGITNNLERRVYEHKQKLVPGFTARYNIIKLVHYEETTDVLAAIAREKEIKGWLRSKKIKLIELSNPDWHDLATDWYKKETLRYSQGDKPDESHYE